MAGSTDSKPVEKEAPPKNDEAAAIPEETSQQQKSMVRSREQRRRLREDLRAKATGKIDIPAVDDTQHRSNKRIVFDDDDYHDKEETSDKEMEFANKEEATEADKVKTEKIGSELKESKRNDTDEDEDDEDDDGVEEVQTSRAREAEKEKRLKERDSARTSLQKQAKKRKRKKTAEKDDEEEKDDEFDEQFFQQLEQEKQVAKEERKRAKKLERQAEGRHTSFVVADEEQTDTIPTTTDGIEVAVISDIVQPSISEPTEESYLYSRDRLENGSDGLSAKQIQKAKRKRQQAQENPSWSRSTKMNRLLAPKQSRRAGGRPAPLFAKSK